MHHKNVMESLEVMDEKEVFESFDSIFRDHAGPIEIMPKTYLHPCQAELIQDLDLPPEGDVL